MSDKVDFHGDVENALIGDINHRTARLSNVVNLHITGAKNEVQRITDYQRKRINLLVKEWAAICGDKEIEIYKIFIADFGIRYFRELPMEHYSTVKDILEKWIAAGTSKNYPVGPNIGMRPLEVGPNRLECAACAEKNSSINRFQKTSFIQWLVISLLAASCAWLLYKIPAPAETASNDVHCFFEGRPYSLGSVINPFGETKQECLLTPDGGTINWVKAK